VDSKIYYPKALDQYANGEFVMTGDFLPIVDLEYRDSTGKKAITAKTATTALTGSIDLEPTWEDMTPQVETNRNYTFTNTEKKADDWGVNLRIQFEKGTATQQITLKGFGGAFD